ncbi:lantipeptide synthetase [Actinoplanes sp. ATCC 53533]|uniref:class III lanthionine synthetase LanKC n=1 Tax=Actinoplanes sp. ATCC 53533 TaxID=1288362 RepID=UPI000F7A322B|nr:class III lanthionine synthetase LanKC [Actinoplanes sp. ATCC 53533]RSM58324.1 lantipeptide synthetase [Actinoplanes sp. ATCC 53533]
MDRRYDAYCAADQLFYDSLATEQRSAGDFPAARRPLPDGWRIRAHDDWLIVGHQDAVLPRQGWKIHSSGCPDNAARIVEKIWDYCVDRGISFKFLRSPQVLFMRNSKYSPRASSGKLATIYPVDTEAMRTVLTELGAALVGEPGPYILSDLRWADGPLYVRYGAFAHLYCVGDDGELLPAVARPDGTLEPDRRQATFSMPDWVSLPSFLQPHLDARNAVTTNDLPYRVTEVLHYSNAGGLYAAEDTRSGERVVLKEARPYAGLDGRGDDAITRLRREREMLERVADCGVTPRVHDGFPLGDHEFLALEYIDGEPLNRRIVRTYPLTDPDADDAALRRYTEWALAVHGQVEQAVRALHERGVVYGDLHMFNIMVRPDGRIALLDFEVAAPVTERRRPGLRNQGFAAPRDRVGPAVDEYALACLTISLFLPLTQLLRLDRTKARHFADIVAAQFPVPRALLERAVAVIEGPPGPRSAWSGARDWSVFDTGPGAWPRARDALVRSILASATPERDDRLYPGDIEQFRVGGLGIAYGAAGVLYALAEAGADIPAEHRDWLVKRAADPGFDPRHGFLDGLHGVAYVLHHLGERQAALDLVDRCLSGGWEGLGPDLGSGVAGIGLNLLHLAEHTGETALRDGAYRAVEIARQRLGGPDAVPEISGGRHPHAGLVRGSSGVALLFLRMYEHTADPEYLDLAGTALRQDLRRCVTRPDGALEVNEGWRTMPYLGEGSVGIGVVLDHYLRHRPGDDLSGAADAIARAARSPLYVQPGLFAGRAGIVAYLALRSRQQAYRTAAVTADDGNLSAQVRRMAWHALPYGGGLAFPGEQLLRLSMDLATGTAGVLLALAVALREQPATLPLLDRRPPNFHADGVGHDDTDEGR